MATCHKCGYECEETDKVCPNCGAELNVAQEKVELVESLAVEAIIISEKGFTLKVHNTGTAVLVVDRIVFYRNQAQIVGVSPPPEKPEETKPTIAPGASAEVTFRTDFSGVSGLSYPTTIISGTGKEYEISVGFP